MFARGLFPIGSMQTVKSAAYPPKCQGFHSDWIESEENVYYFAKPVAPGEMTENLIKPISLTTDTDADGNTVYMVVQAIAEAIQANPETAAAQAWGVTVTKGAITAVPRQKRTGDETGEAPN